MCGICCEDSCFHFHCVQDFALFNVTFLLYFSACTSRTELNWDDCFCGNNTARASSKYDVFLPKEILSLWKLWKLKNGKSYFRNYSKAKSNNHSIKTCQHCKAKKKHYFKNPKNLYKYASLVHSNNYRTCNR